VNVRHPSDIILQHMGTRGWRQIDLCRASGISDSVMSRLVGKKHTITPRVAIALSRAFDIPANTWLGYQAQWDLHKERSKA
jgi:plasmid maintenance system antidote protein VapI